MHRRERCRVPSLYMNPSIGPRFVFFLSHPSFSVAPPPSYIHTVSLINTTYWPINEAWHLAPSEKGWGSAREEMDGIFHFVLSKVKDRSMFWGSPGLSGDQRAGFVKTCCFQPDFRVPRMVLGPQIPAGLKSGSLRPAQNRGGWGRICTSVGHLARRYLGAPKNWLRLLGAPGHKMQ